jgi:hypothetical protein
MAALLVHVREQRFLIGEIRRSRRGRCEQRESVPHVMIGLREKIQIHRARRAAAHDLANERDRLEPFAFGRGVRDQAVVKAHRRLVSRAERVPRAPMEIIG